MAKRKIFIIVSAVLVAVAGGAMLLWPESAQNTGKPQDVLSAETTQRFDRELQECLAYNQNLYDHDRLKIERANVSATSNPKEVRLKTLEEWYHFEQQACRDFHESRVKTLESNTD